ncbi:MAG: RNA polymerase sigma factor [Minwuiales bacterium]|nr:RNA polymerase sigma factor [Minwuiales bacterium]
MSEQLKAEIAALVPRLRRFAYAISGSREEGDDLVQTACVKALSRIDQYRPGTRLDSWMFRIVQNTHIDAIRSRKRFQGSSDAETLERLSDEGREADRNEHRLLLAKARAAIAALPEQQRAVIALVAIEGYSYKEAAAILDTPVGTVMSRLNRARANLLPLMAETTP